MPCRVGITTNPEERRVHWEAQVVGLTNWKILDEYWSREQAQEHEDRYARRYGCQASHGGAPAQGPWYVYRFDYTRTK